jgi:hypothetical protein
MEYRIGQTSLLTVLRHVTPTKSEAHQNAPEWVECVFLIEIRGANKT